MEPLPRLPPCYTFDNYSALEIKNFPGPYAAKEMLMWTQSGYFNDSLLIRTEHEERFHTLGEWTRVCGGKVCSGLSLSIMLFVAGFFLRSVLENVDVWSIFLLFEQPKAVYFYNIFNLHVRRS